MTDRFVRETIELALSLAKVCELGGAGNVARLTENVEGIASIRVEAARDEHDMPPMNLQEVRAAHISAATGWRRCGFPRLVLSHKHAASLICTSVSREHLREVAPPWSTCVVDVPSGLIWREDARGRRDVAHLFVVGWESGNVTVLVADDREPFDGIVAGNVAALCDADVVAPYLSACARLAVGALIEAMSYRPRGVGGGERSVRCNSRGEPVTDTIVIRRDVRMDCREAVARSMSRRSGPPTVQVMVRGHWRMQACGVKHSERKFIHVEPYWRGPEDAPIAVRGHVLDSSAPGAKGAV